MEEGGGMETRAAASSNSHKEAERRRRNRINGHIATLKTILPNVVKTDKASLLGEAVRRVKELNKAAQELSSCSTEELELFPSETDEFKLCPCDDPGLVKATLCCEDRPDILMDLVQALKSVEAKVVRAEMSTVGGRTMSVLWIRLGIHNQTDVGLAMLRRALKLVIDKCAFCP